MRKHITLFLLFLMLNLAKAQNFITKWNLATAGSGANKITFTTTNSSGSISYTWQEISPGSSSGSGTFSSGTNVTRTISGLPTGALIRVEIAPTNLQRFYINNNSDRNRITDIEQWGTTNWLNMASAFEGCANLNISATDVPILNAVSNFNLSNMFYNCTSLNSANFNTWDISYVSSFAFMFFGCSDFNQPLDNWGTQFGDNTGSNAISFNSMFRSCVLFNQDLSNWDVTKVSNFSLMFYNCEVFNNAGQTGIASWSLGTNSIITPSSVNIVNCSSMFAEASMFNQNINNWDVSKVTDFSSMFQNATSYNQPMDNWGTQLGSNTATAYITMSSMFRNADAFNQDLSNWDVSKVSNFSLMFFDNDAFNNAGQPGISSWSLGTNSIITPSTHNVVNCGSMFYGASV